MVDIGLPNIGEEFKLSFLRGLHYPFHGVKMAAWRELRLLSLLG